jgi:hypothetical protein
MQHDRECNLCRIILSQQCLFQASQHSTEFHHQACQHKLLAAAKRLGDPLGHRRQRQATVEANAVTAPEAEPCRNRMP